MEIMEVVRRTGTALNGIAFLRVTGAGLVGLGWTFVYQYTTRIDRQYH